MMGRKRIPTPKDEGYREGYRMDNISVTSSVALGTYEKRRMKQLIDDILQSRSSRQYLKMLSYQLIPLIALVVMCSILVAQSFMTHRSARLLQVVIQENDKIGRLVTSLQIERGLTTTHLSSNRTQSNVYEELVTARRTTDEAFDMITNWPDTLNIESFSGPCDKTRMQYEIRRHRKHVDNRYNKRFSSYDLEVSFMKNIVFYTNINAGLIDTSIFETKQLEASIWYQLIAKQSLFKATDFYGIERALDSVYYVTCALNDNNLSWFRTLRTQGDMMLNQAISFHAKVKRAYKEYLNRADVQLAHAYIAKMREEILDDSHMCTTEKSENSLIWFNNSTTLIGILSDVSEEISNDILKYVETTKQNTSRMIILYSLTGALTILACVILSVFHARKSHTLLSSISYYAKDLSEKKTELASEKKLTLRLVYQLIPKGVAKQLQAGKAVEAMVFEEVTIYFSNIEGFANFAARSTPMQVINLLNQLYSICDDCIESHQVYKVDTVGDAYMIVSGIPEPNNSHAFEIASMAVQLLNITEKVDIPGFPDEKIKFRIGIHTGSCAAGVIGVQMPRYCLFGDSVNTASIMEATGKARKIHISESTMMALEIERKTDQFRVVPRGELDIKVKGTAMHTYWLERAVRHPDTPDKCNVIWDGSAMFSDKNKNHLQQ